MNRRSFLVRSGLAALGATALPVLLSGRAGLQAAEAAAPLAAGPEQLTEADRALLRLLAAYSTDVAFWGGEVFARATGTTPQGGTTRLFVQVADHGLLTAFFRSDALKSLRQLRVADNTLSFTFQDTAYVVTNQDARKFAQATTAGSRSRQRQDDGEVALFEHEALTYRPTTNALSDPCLVLRRRRLELAEEPTGGARARFQTLVQGWLEARRYGLRLGKKFSAFAAELLASEPTDRAARKIVQALLANISQLAAAFDVADLRPLLTSPLVSASLARALGLRAGEVLAAVERLRAELAVDDYSDAAIWLTTLLGSRSLDGELHEWLDLSGGDAAAVVTRAALPGARRLARVRGLTWTL